MFTILRVTLLLLAAGASSPAFSDAKIVGGNTAEPGEWPWQVFLEISGFQCGGSILDPQWIVTAAHCAVDEMDRPVQPADVSGFAGIYDLTQTAGTQALMASQVIVHPAYDSFTSDNDIALLRLTVPLVLTQQVQPVPLIEAGAGDLTGETAWITGWGDIADGGPGTDILLEVSIPILSNPVCESWYDANAGQDDWITANMLCAGLLEGGKDSCQGDSGGPLVVDRSGGGDWELAGIVSWGLECAGAGLPGVYTRVSQYLAWIDEQTGGLETDLIFRDDFEGIAVVAKRL